MKAKLGSSHQQELTAALAEALADVRQATFILVQTTLGDLKQVATYLQTNFPGVASLATSGQSYLATGAEQTLVALAFEAGVAVETGVLTKLATAPLRDLYTLEQKLQAIKPNQQNTICVEYCTNDEEVTVSSMNVALEKYGVPLLGGSVFDEQKRTSEVLVDGQVYQDACGFALIKNLDGKINTYSENIYEPVSNASRHIATKVDLKTKTLVELDNQPAAEVYSQETGLPAQQIIENVLNQPLGRLVGDNYYIFSMHELAANGALVNYKRVNKNDTVAILQLADYQTINRQTLERIKRDNPRPELILSFNCIFRHQLFQKEGYLPTYLRQMGTLGPYLGYVCGGEQYGKQHVNQTMICAVFE